PPSFPSSSDATAPTDTYALSLHDALPIYFNWDGWMAGYDIANGIHTPTSSLIGNFWSACYEVVNRCNTLISRIDNIEMDASKKRSEEHTSELQSRENLVCRLLLEKKKKLK